MELTIEQRNQIREIAQVLKQTAAQNLAILVVGHSDNRGSRQTNHYVALQRAQTVANELVFNGIAPERMTVESRGETEPIAPNTDADGRARNRRVDVSIQKSAANGR